jgi:HEAT repeat protein
MRCLVAVILTVVACGCGAKAPLTAHGKPVTYWVQSLQSPDAGLRKKAVTSLGHVGTADPAAVPALAGAVRDRDAAVRGEAVLALLNLGPAARDALPALEEAQRDGDARVRYFAAKALARVRGEK